MSVLPLSDDHQQENDGSWLSCRLAIRSRFLDNDAVAFSR